MIRHPRLITIYYRTRWWISHVIISLCVKKDINEHSHSSRGKFFPQIMTQRGVLTSLLQSRLLTCRVMRLSAVTLIRCVSLYISISTDMKNKFRDMIFSPYRPALAPWGIKSTNFVDHWLFLLNTILIILCPMLCLMLLHYVATSKNYEHVIRWVHWCIVGRSVDTISQDK